MNETEDLMSNVINNNGGSNPSLPAGWDPNKVSKYESSDGKDVPIPDGFTVDESQGKSVEDGIVIKDADGNEWVWVQVADTSTMFDTANNSGQLYDFIENTYTKITYSGLENREPAYLTDSTFGDTSSHNTVGITQSSLQIEFNQMKVSVEKYKGFYIGRYETGNLSGTRAKVQRGQTDIGGQNWYTMYKLGKEMYSSNTAVQSSMIWGCQWDQVMIWMKDIPNITNPSKYYITDSTDMGNITGTIAPTGSNENYKVKNIYDMAGNASDWTLEGNSTFIRVLRRRLSWYLLFKWLSSYFLSNQQ